MKTSVFYSSSSVLILFLGVLLIPVTFQLEDRYTKDSNTNFRELEKPFRMMKINMVWHNIKQKVSDTELRSLYTDYLALDEYEAALKRLKADGLDKDGLREAALRKKFKGVFENYFLLTLHYFDEDALQEEFRPYQDKIDEYFFSSKTLNSEYEKTANDIQSKIDLFCKKVASWRESKEFSEPMLASFERIATALKTYIPPEKLDPLHPEPKHYEERVEKLQHLSTEEYMANMDYIIKNFMNVEKEKEKASLLAEQIKRHEELLNSFWAMEKKRSNRHNEL